MDNEKNIEFDKHDEWLKKIKKASGIEDKEIKKEEKTPEEKKKEKNRKIANILIFLGVLVLAIAPRLYFLFFVSGTQNAGVGWYGDTYHHWQIAYFTQEIGLSHGFLRLWDLKGMEFFWGVGHPIALMSIMKLTGSIDILNARLLSLFAGSASIAILFLFVRKKWGLNVALATALLGALNPVSIFNDASGMVEPLGMLFLFLAIYLWPKKALLAGTMFAIASTIRAEFWLFSIGLILAILIFSKQKIDKKLAVLLSYLLLTIIYMKYLVTYTGNLIYPIWWNFLGNAKGEWQADIPLTSAQVAVQPIWIGMFILSLIAILFIFWKKPKGILLHLLGFGSFLFLGFFVGFTAYMKSYVHYFWVVRIFSLPYLYLGFFVSFIFLVVISKKIRLFRIIGWIFILAVLVISQYAWTIIWKYYEPTNLNWDKEVKIAKEIKTIYKGGTILMHEGDPVLTYALVKYAGIKAENIQGQMYDPFQYSPFIDYSEPFEEWSEDREIIINWIKRDNIKLLIFQNGRKRYLDLVEREPRIFKFVKDEEFEYKIYEVRI